MNFSGNYFQTSFYGVNEEGFIDYEEVRRIALEEKPKLIMQGQAPMQEKSISRNSARLLMRQVPTLW